MTVSEVHAYLLAHPLAGVHVKAMRPAHGPSGADRLVLIIGGEEYIVKDCDTGTWVFNVEGQGWRLSPPGAPLPCEGLRSRLVDVVRDDLFRLRPDPADLAVQANAKAPTVFGEALAAHLALMSAPSAYTGGVSL